MNIRVATATRSVSIRRWGSGGYFIRKHNDSHAKSQPIPAKNQETGGAPTVETSALTFDQKSKWVEVWKNVFQVAKVSREAKSIAKIKSVLFYYKKTVQLNVFNKIQFSVTNFFKL